MTLMFITFLVILLLGAPIYVAIGGSALLPLVMGVVPLDATLVPQATINGMSNSVLVAVALFFIAGSLMESSALTKELLEFADSLVGHMYGGMGMATIVASAFFAALTGSGLAATVAIGSITIGGMVERRYSKSLAGAVAATGGALGVLIPPSNPMIIYAVLSGTSVGALFTAGLVPGILITITLSAVMYVIGRKNKLVDTSRKFSGKAVLKSIWKSKWALLAPVIILGSIYSGICTPTEAAEIAVLYSICYGFLIKRTLRFKTFIMSFRNGAITAATMLVMSGVAGGFGRIITMYQLPQTIGRFIANFTTNPHIVMLMLLVFLLFTGCFLETLSQIIILTPIFLPILTSLGVSPLVFGVIFVLMIEIGFLTPPIGGNLFVAVKLTGEPIMKISKHELPFIAVFLGYAILFIFCPEIVTFLPKLLGYGA
jgi:C4-dicarboxylate transporter, DctM subunit